MIQLVSDVNSYATDVVRRAAPSEGIALLDAQTLAISNDNDFDSEESKYDSEGNNLGKGKKSQILLISLDKPLPLPKATVSAR